MKPPWGPLAFHNMKSKLIFQVWDARHIDGRLNDRTDRQTSDLCSSRARSSSVRADAMDANAVQLADWQTASKPYLTISELIATLGDLIIYCDQNDKSVDTADRDR